MEGERRERIRELPEEIKQQIVSCLSSTRDAISTSALSSAWRYLWLSIPSFDFGSRFFHHFSNTYPQSRHLYDTIHQDDDNDDYYTDNGSDDDDDDDDDYKYNNWKIEHVGCGYIQLLDQIFQNFTTKRQPFDVVTITKLSLYVPGIKEPAMRAFASNVVLQWLFLAKHSIEVLSLWVDVPCGFYGSFTYRHYAFQSCHRILEYKRLTKLELQNCYLSSKDREEVVIDLPCLKHLCLMFSKVDQMMLDILLAECGALEKLKLESCEGFKVLRVPKWLSKLKEVCVKGTYGLDLVEINAMSLECLTLRSLQRLQIEVCQNFYTNLVELFINDCGITDDFFSNVSEFPRLKILFLRGCPMLKGMKIVSKPLQKLEIEKCRNLRLVELDAPKLFGFRYSTAGCGGNIITLVSKFPMKHVSLYLARPRDATLNHILWHSKLIALLENFSHSTYVDLRTTSKKNVIIPQEVRESFSRPSPLSGVKHLFLTVPKSLTRHVVVEYLDSLLWLSSQPSSIFLSSLSCEESQLFLKLEYEDKIKEVNCWRSVLKDFTILHQSGIRDCDNTRELVEHALKMMSNATPAFDPE